MKKKAADRGIKRKINPGFFIDTSETGIKSVRLGRERIKAHSRNSSEGLLARRWKRVAENELRAYFAGQLRSFSAPCDLRSLPSFTRAVLKIAGQIPYGEVRSYRWIAQRMGKPMASRAVGNALARNPIPIVIPCHRVVRSDDTLGGFALGLDWKRRLLMLENSHRSRGGGALRFTLHSRSARVTARGKDHG